jgi:SAM-dependent methyltransferase
MLRRRRTAAASLEPQPDPRAPLDIGRFLAAAGPVLRGLQDDLLARATDWPDVSLRARNGEAADAFDVRRSAWVEQVAAAWLLSVVFVRTLEDRGLVQRARIAGPGAPEDLDLLAVFREMADIGATREIFDPQHNLVHCLTPRPEAVAALLALFRTPSTESPAFRFGQPDARFLGDLYQNLDHEARKRHALLQTPSFVVEYILDRTLERSIREHGIEDAGVLDPTCGSGHFLLGAFDRLFGHHLAKNTVLAAATRAHAAVAGVDVIPHAVAIARMRLLLAFLDTAEIKGLEQAPELSWNLAVGDSLVLGRTKAPAPGVDDEGASRILNKRYAVVVGNPPYISVKDKELRERYRELYPRSASQNYPLSAPFLERYYPTLFTPSEDRSASRPVFS